MAFATPLFLAALAAVSVPIIIHLIYRLKKRQVIFGTLRFLKIVQQKNARMLQIREILLLLLRIAAFACIALAFARPFLSGSEVEARVLSGRTDMVAVVDILLKEEESARAEGRRTNIPMRPDHGHLMAGDIGRKSNPGYSYDGRMKGLAELRGVMAALQRPAD